MRKTTIALFMILNIFSQALAERNTDPFFKDLKQSKYGSEIAETIQLELENGGNIDLVVDMVYDIQKQVRAQQEEKSNEHQVQNDRCLDNRSEIQRVIDSAQVKRDKQQQIIDIDEPLLQFRIEEKARKEQEASERQSMVDTLTNERNAERERYNQLVHEHEQVRMMIDEAREIMTGLLDEEGETASEDAFLELDTSKVEQTFFALKTKLESFQAKDSGPTAHFNNMFLIMIKMVERAPHHSSQYLVQSILNVLDRLQDNLQRSLEIERTAERTREADFEELIDRLNELSYQLPGQIASLANDINTLNQRLQLARDEIVVQQQVMDDNQQMYDDIDVQCQQIENQYAAYNDFVTNQLRVLRNALYLLEDRRDDLARICGAGGYAA